MLLRTILIFVLIGYVLYKLGLFNSLTGSGKDNGQQRGGNVNIDNDPGKEKRRAGYKGGEYVDYEEVKD